MPIGVVVKGVGKRLFPDDMAPDQIREVLQSKFPMDTASRMQRAKEQGFSDQTYYHGTAADIKEFETGRLGSSTGHPSSGLGTYLTTSPKTASDFTKDFSESEFDKAAAPFKQGGNVIQSKAALDNPKTITHKEFRELFVDENKKARTKEDFEAIRGQLSSEGYDGIVIQGSRTLEGRMAPPGLEEFTNDQVIVFDPKNIRSTNAAFDPAKRDSANILAGSGALAVGAGALGSDDVEAGVVGKILTSAGGIPNMLSIDDAIRKMDAATDTSIDLQAVRRALSKDGADTLVEIEVDPKTLKGFDDIDVDSSRAKPGKGSIIIDGEGNIIDGRRRAALAAKNGETIKAFKSDNTESLVNRYQKGEFKQFALPTTGAMLAAGAALPETARADSKGSIQGANVPELQQAADILEKLELPVIGKPFQGLADWARGAAYNDKDKLKRALVAALDLM